MSLCIVLRSVFGNLLLNCGSILKESKTESHIPAVNALGDIDTNSAESLMFSGLSLDAILGLQSV